MIRSFISIILLIGIVSSGADGEQFFGSGPLEKTIITGRDSVEKTFSLGVPFVFYGSDSLYLKRKLLERGRDYSIDYNKGSVCFAARLQDADTIKAFFKALPLALPGLRQYLPLLSDTVNGELLRTGETLSHADADSLNKWYQKKDGQLWFGGDKSLGIVMGTGRDISLEQSLNVRVNGKLGPTLEVNAMLSDQGMPISGSTQELSQIDKVFLQANSANWSAAVGDYDLSYRKQELLRVKRQLQGLTANIHYDDMTAGVVVANSKGRPGYNRLAGQDGKQGPYQLTITEGGGTFRVLSNSERVWLDGLLMQKGNDRDYSIDYELGQVTFTPGRLITSDSRIVAEFEYAFSSFYRQMYITEGNRQWGDNFTVTTAYYSESDDPQHPSIGEMNNVWQQVLEKAGDDTSRLWGDGGIAVDSGIGDYIYQDSIYVYVGLGYGNRQVSFTWKGTGQGDYIYNSLTGGYNFVGQGLGDYVALKKYFRPESFQSLGLQTKFDWEGVKILLGGANTWNDLNLMSGLDDQNNSGLGAKYDLAWRRDSLNWGGFQITGKGIYLGEHYQPLLAVRETDFENRWSIDSWSNLKSYDPLDGQKSQEYGLSYWPGKSLKLGGQWGRLSLDKGLWLRKYTAFSRLRPWAKLGLFYQYNKILLGRAWQDSLIVSGERQAHQSDLEWDSEWFKYQAGLKNTNDINRYTSGASLGSRITDAFLGFAARGRTLEWGSRYLRREEQSSDSLADLWQGTSYANQIKSFASFKNGSTFSSSIDHTFWQKVIRPNSSGQGLKSNLALMRLEYSPWQQAVRTGLDYSLNSTESRIMKELYIKVLDRAGDYSYDSLSGIYFPDTVGNYIRQLLEEGPAVRASEVTARSYLFFEPGLHFDPAWWTSFKMSLSTLTSIKSLQPLTPALLSAFPATGNDPRDLHSLADISGDAGYFGETGWGLRFIGRWIRERDNQIETASFVKRILERRVEVNYPFSKTWSSLFYFSSNITESYNSQYVLESGARPDIAGFDLTYRLNPYSDLNGKLEMGRESVERYNYSLPFPRINYRHWLFSSSLVRRLSMSGQLRIEGGLTYREADQSAVNIPMEFAYTRPLNWTRTWRGSYDYRINNYFTASASYDGRKKDEGRTIHNGRMEIRAYF